MVTYKQGPQIKNIVRIQRQTKHEETKSFIGEALRGNTKEYEKIK